MKNFAVWIVLISTAALGVAVAEPIEDLSLAMRQEMIFSIC
jgi:hypothetical protein